MYITVNIKVDYYIKQEGHATRILHTEVREEDIMEMLEKRFKDGDIPCPCNFDMEKLNVRFEITSVTTGN